MWLHIAQASVEGGRVNGYYFDLNCPSCGGALEHANEGPVIGGEVTAVASCIECGQDSSVHVRVYSMVKTRKTRAIQREIEPNYHAWPHPWPRRYPQNEPETSQASHYRSTVSVGQSD